MAILADLNRPRLTEPSFIGAAVLVLLLTIAGGLLRFYDLDGKSLWRDELETYVMAKADYRTLTALSLEVPYIPVPPLYFYATRFLCFQLFPGASLRFPAAVFGLLLVPAIWLLGREIFRPAAAGIGAGLVCLSPFFIRYSQEARGYSLLALLTALSALFLVRAVREGSLRDWAGFVLFTVLGLYTHHFALLTLAAAVVYHLLARWRRTSGFRGRAAGILGSWPAWAAILASWLPLAGHLWKGLTGPRGLNLEGGASNMRWTDLPALFSVIGPARSPWVWVVVALALLGAFSLSPWRRGGKSLVVLWLILPFSLAAVIPFKHVMRLRYLIFIIPAYYLLVAAGLARLLEKREGKPWPRRATLAVSLLLAVSAAAGIHGYFREGKQDWRSVARFLKAAAGPRDVILVDGRDVRDLNLRYQAMEYYAGLGEKVRIINSAGDPSDWLHRRDEEGSQLWYVNTLARKSFGLEELIPDGGRSLVRSGWNLRPPLKFDAPARLSPREVWWIGPIRYRSLVVVPIEKGAASGEDETGRLLQLASAVPGAAVDRRYTERHIREAGR